MVIKNLRASRENYLFLKQKDIALLLGVSYQSISNWENERDINPLKRLIKYADFFNFSLDFLFGINNNIYNRTPININLKSIGENLLKLRKLNNMSQTDIIKKLNGYLALFLICIYYFLLFNPLIKFKTKKTTYNWKTKTILFFHRFTYYLNIILLT